MQLNEYSEKAAKTAIYGTDYEIVYPALGLASEAGEFAGKVKKVLRDQGGIFQQVDKESLMLELGDVLWYVAALARDIGFSLEVVAQHNLDKLQSRAERNVIKGSGDNR